MKNSPFSTLKGPEIVRLLEEPTQDRRPLKFQLKREAPTKELIKALWMSENVLTSRILCDILGAKRARTAIPALLNCLNHPNPSLKDDAAEALGKIGSPKAGREILEHFIVEPRSWYAIALGAVKYDLSIPYLINALSGSDSKLRGGAAWSLGELRAVEALNELEKVLTIETDSYSKARILEAIDKIKNTVER